MNTRNSGIIPTGTSSREKVVSDEKKKTDAPSTKTVEAQKQEDITRKIKELKPGDFKALGKTFSAIKNYHSKNKDDIYYKYNTIIKYLTNLNSINSARSTKYDKDLLAAIDGLHSEFSAKETIKKDCSDCKNVRISFPENSFDRLKQCFESIINENPQ